MFVLHYQPLGQATISQFINTQCTINTLLSNIVSNIHMVPMAWIMCVCVCVCACVCVGVLFSLKALKQ